MPTIAAPWLGRRPQKLCLVAGALKQSRCKSEAELTELRGIPCASDFVFYVLRRWWWACVASGLRNAVGNLQKSVTWAVTWAVGQSADRCEIVVRVPKPCVK